MFLRANSKLMAVLFAVLPVFQMTATAQDALSLEVSAPEFVQQLSLSDLDALDQENFTTSTLWTDGDMVFSGVPLKTILAHFDLAGETLEMVALNDYAVTMPIADLEDNAPIVATRINGAPMAVRDKGPFWVVFPYDAEAKYQTEITYSRSIWQLSKLRVLD